MKRFSKLRWGILTGISTVLVIAVFIGADFAFNKGASAINMALGTSDYKKVEDPDAEPEELYKSDYDFMTPDKKTTAEAPEKLFKEDSKAAENAELEGCVLLWNKDSTLPLGGGKKVSLLSHSSVDLVECGSGSGFIKTTALKGKQSVAVNLKDAFTEKGYTVNTTLWDFYKSGGGAYSRVNPGTYCTEWRRWYINEAPWSQYTNTIKNSFSTYNDVAFIVISRTGGEYSDLHYNYESETDYIGLNDKGSQENTSAEGGYLGLTKQEKDLISNICSYRNNGTFKKLVLLLNTPNPIMFKHLQSAYSNIDAAMWIGQPGTTGIKSVIDLLRGTKDDGTKVSPSGRLTDTFMYDLNSAPSTVNDGNFRYGNHSLLSGDSKTADDRLYNTYAIYAENIYVGYRYYETRYEDTIYGAGGASSTKGSKMAANWAYDKEVAFPFGYGDSYSKFKYDNYSCAFNSKTNAYDMKVKVTNIGSVPAKEVVQAYLQKPYTDFDKANGIEKSAIELVGYKKTKTLAPNASEEVIISVSKESFKTYDAEVHKTYIIEAGNYYLTLGNDSHSALNNVLLAKGNKNGTYNVFGGYEKNNNVSLGSSFVSTFKLNDDFTTYSKSTQTGFDITNQFNESDMNKYSNRGTNHITYLSRNDWDGTYPIKPTDSAPALSLNKDMVKDLRRDVARDDTGYTAPTYGAKNGLNVTDLFDAPLYPELADEETKKKVYEDGLSYVDHWNAQWNKLMDQTTFAEQSLFCSDAYHRMQGCVSVGLPESKQENGPVGITARGDFPVPNNDIIADYYYVCYPCAGILASSFNDEVAFDVGKHKSEDMLFTGYNGIYGPGINMHRTPFCGRAFEYPSEDPYLAGTISYNESAGISTKGCMAFAKHFAMNDQETNRRHVGVWSKEQATREIYLRAFEIAFAEGGATATMNGFNRIGTKWCAACDPLVDTLLRKEWGWTGVNITDWMSDGPMSYVDALSAGTNSFDGNGSSTKFDSWKSNKLLQTKLRESSRVIIYNVLHSNAVPNSKAAYKVYVVTPWWRAAIYSIEGFAVGLLAYSGVFFAFSWLMPVIDKQGASKIEQERIKSEAEAAGEPLGKKEGK